MILNFAYFSASLNITVLLYFLVKNAEVKKMSDIEVYESSLNYQHEIMRLSPSAKFILYLLKQKGPMNRKRIINETMMPDRTVGFALKMLLEKNLIEKVDLLNSLDYNEGILNNRRKKHKLDHRITSYQIVSPILPFEIQN